MSLTCIACRQTFQQSKDQREHYRSEFHRFNIKRKSSGLPTISPEMFEQVKQQAKDQIKQDATPYTGYCSTCRKNFSSEKTMKQHMLSKKHLEKEKASNKTEEVVSNGKAEEVENLATKTGNDNTTNNNNNNNDVDESKLTEEELIAKKVEEFENAEPVDLRCSFFFVGSDSNILPSSSLKQNLQFMAKEYGFTIPMVEYCIDIESLLQFVAKKINIAQACLFCNKTFRSKNAAIQHMISSGHCKINFEEHIEEYEDYYDFSIVTPDDVDLPINNTTTNEDGSSNDELAPAQISATGFEMKINDKIIVHREMAVYANQRLRKPESRNAMLIRQMMKEYRTLGITTTQQQKAIKLKNRTKQQAHQKKLAYNMQLGVKANKLQKHFREQVLY